MTLTAARQGRLQRLLESYGPLTRDHLAEFAHAEGWAVDFDVVLARAVRAGRIRCLAGRLYAAPPPDDSLRPAEERRLSARA
jgi:hypothetical protein